MTDGSPAMKLSLTRRWTKRVRMVVSLYIVFDLRILPQLPLSTPRLCVPEGATTPTKPKL